MTIDVISGVEIFWFLYYVMLIYHFAIWLSHYHLYIRRLVNPSDLLKIRDNKVVKIRHLSCKHPTPKL